MNTNHVIVAALRSDYGIEATAMQPTDRGKDFAARVLRVRAGGRKPRYIVKVRAADAPRDVPAAVARYLAETGVPGVVAPIPSRSGAVSVRTENVSLTVYPFIDGQIGIEMHMSDDSWRRLGSFARRLHATVFPPELAAIVPRETYRPNEIDLIARIDGADRRSRRRDATARTVGELWRGRREDILALAERTQTLGDALRQQSLPLVTCHADMHTGNVIVDRTGALWIIDWDDVVLAPKERDLMFAVGGGISTKLVDPNATERFLEGYGDVDTHEIALAYYRHAWAVQDVAGYAWSVLLDTSAADDQREDAARIFVGLFEPGEIVDLAARSRYAGDAALPRRH
jgi:spectinomycin phosphotransferase